MPRQGQANPGSESPTLILKFGSSVIPSESALRDIVSEIVRHRATGARIIAVVSAIGGATDALIAHARLYTGASPHALAAYVATGELQAAALLGLALGRAGIDAAILDAAAISLRTEGPPLDASPISLDKTAIEQAFAHAPILIIPGFLGRSARNETTLLGRGGSDFTALFLAHHLGARCRLVKDVDGLYDDDPASNPAARRYARIHFDNALGLSGGIVQHKATRFARDHNLTFEVGTLGASYATTVGAQPSALDAESEPSAAKARVCARTLSVR